MSPDADRHRVRTGADQEQLADDHHDVEDILPGGYDCELLELVARLAGRVLDLEHRLATAGVPGTPDPLARQRAHTRARLEAISPLARFVADRERVSR